MEVFIIVFSFVFSLFAVGSEIRKILKHKNISISSLVGIMFVFTYGVLPLLVLWMHRFSGVTISTVYYQYDYSDKGLTYTFIWQLLGCVSYVIIRALTKNSNELLKKDAYVNDGAAIEVTTCVCLALGIVSLFLWSKAYGGMINLIKSASKVRSGLSDVNNKLAFFKHPGRMVIITSFSSLLLLKNHYRKILNAALFCISFVCALLFLLANDGRMSFMLYFAILIFISFDIFSEKKLTKKRILLLCLLAFSGMVFILKLDSITMYIRYGTFETDTSVPFLTSVINELSFVMISGQNSIEHATMQNPLLLDDILNGIQAWLPSSLKFFNATNIWNYNTDIVTYNFFGQFPCDFISTAMYDLPYLGVILFGLFWGNVLKKIECLRIRSGLFPVVCYYAVSTSLFRMVDYCMLYDFILGIFSFTVFAMLYFVNKKIIYRK